MSDGREHSDTDADVAGTPTPETATSDAPGAGRRLAVALALYTVARLALVVVIAAIIYGVGRIAGVAVPLLVAAIFAVVIALPLGMIVFRPLRTRVNVAIAEVDADRRDKRADLQARLRGENT